MASPLYESLTVYSLRDYQQKMVDIATHTLKTSDKPFILQAATGAGKSLIIAAICRDLDEPVLVLQPSKELLEQNYAKLKSYDIEDIGIYSASMNRREIAKFTYATIGSIRKKPEDFKKFKYVLLDECHNLNPSNQSSMLIKFLKDIECTRVCGLTATPYRLVQKYFEEHGALYYTSHLRMVNRIHPFFFKSIKYKIETQELIDRGYLCPILYRQGGGVDLSELQVNSTGADFTTESLERFWTDKRLARMAGIIKRIDANCQRNLVFCSSLLQARKCREMLSVMGIRAEIVDGKTPAKERERLVGEFKDGTFKHMINVGVFTTGFDVVQLDCVVLARPTMSLALYYQMVGRGVRIDPARPEKKLRVYDLAGVVDTFGKVESIRIVKEETDTWKDMVVSDAGPMTEVPLFKYLVKNKSKFIKGNQA